MALAPCIWYRQPMREGLLPHTVATVLRLSTTGDKAKALTEVIGEVFDPTETAVSAFEVEDKGPSSPWSVEIYFASPPDEEAVRDLLRQIVGDHAATATFDSITQKDWVKSSLDGLKPIRAGRFLIHGSHDRQAVKSNDVALEIDAALAFGTGHHGTTAGCLLAIDALLKRGRPQTAIDVGAGTGILALGLAKAARISVVAGDIDPEAVRVARDNAKLNGARGLLDLYVGPGVRHTKAWRIRGYDVVIANILQRPLMRLSPSLSKVMASSGTLILSGLLMRDVPGVLAAYRMQGLTLAARAEREGWATLVMKRGGASPRRPRI
jgi:ribosomal protein L11 methyltransferase